MFSAHINLEIHKISTKYRETPNIQKLNNILLSNTCTKKKKSQGKFYDTLNRMKTKPQHTKTHGSSQSRAQSPHYGFKHHYQKRRKISNQFPKLLPEEARKAN